MRWYTVLHSETIGDNGDGAESICRIMNITRKTNYNNNERKEEEEKKRSAFDMGFITFCMAASPKRPHTQYELLLLLFSFDI